MKKIVYIIITILFLIGLSSCKKEEFAIRKWENSYGERENTTSYQEYDSSYSKEKFQIIPVKELQDNKRPDFLMAVDASMVWQIYQNGGVYYNLEGKEQNVWQILANAGVNAIRLRLWVKDGNLGGGNCTKENVLKMILEARKVNMKFILDLHYSDFWADPGQQKIPAEWEGLSHNQLIQKVYEYTKETVLFYKKNGVVPQYIQIGNEINNGLLWENGKLDWNNTASFDNIAEIISAGIRGAKEAYGKIKTIIHLADGGDEFIFNFFFEELEKREIAYDVIGASFYTYYHGELTSLKANMDKLAQRFKKPLFIVEMSYAYTFNSHPLCANIFGEDFVEKGFYPATILGQATCIRDTIEVVAQIPNNLGLGVCYWGADWLPVKNAGWGDEGTLASWSNQALFTYEGRALPSIEVFHLVKK